MPFDACIAAALKEGEIDEEKAGRLRDIYSDHLEGFSADMPRAEAMAEAARSAFRWLDAEAAEKRRQAFLTLSTRNDIMGRLDGYKSYLTGKDDPYTGATGLFDRLLPGRKGFAVEQQREYWRNAAHAMMDQAFKAFRPTWRLARRNQPLVELMVRELFGEKTGDHLAATIAEGWSKAAEYLRSNFNRFGGHIGQLEKWGLPQGHDRQRIWKEGLEQWREFTVPLLDLNKMVDRDTGRPFGEANPVLRESSIRVALGGVFENIVTDGWSDREASAVGGKARANRRADPRFLTFKDAESWLAYQKRFGEPDPVNTMLRHIDSMARDISLMQVLGPNPASTLRWLKSELTRRAAIAHDKGDRVTRAMNRIGVMYDMTTGTAHAPENAMLAAISADVGNMLGAAQLGSAVLTVIPSDLGLQTVTRAMNGMPVMRMFKTMLGQLNPADPEHRIAAIRLGAGAHSFGQTLATQARYMGELHGHRSTRVILDRTLHFAGLTPWHEAARASFFADSLGQLADNAAKAWGELKPRFAAALSRYGIDEPEWDAIRGTKPYEDIGAKFIRPEDVANRADLDASRAMDLAQKIHDFASTETEFSAPEHSLAGAAAARGRTARGSWQSLWQDSILKYKTFAWTVLMSHGRRLVAQGNWQKRSQYFGALALTSMFAGAMSLQMREIAQGRDPRDMEDPHFWPAAIITGGGLSIIADFVYEGLQGASRTGGGFGESVAGPIAGMVGDLFRAAIGAPMTPSQQDLGARWGTNVMEFVKRYMPGGNLWYARLVLERAIWDQVQQDIDPDWPKRLRNVENWYRTNYHNGFWWQRGQMTPARGPDLGNVAGGTQ